MFDVLENRIVASYIGDSGIMKEIYHVEMLLQMLQVENYSNILTINPTKMKKRLFLFGLNLMFLFLTVFNINRTHQNSTERCLFKNIAIMVKANAYVEPQPCVVNGDGCIKDNIWYAFYREK